MTLHLVLALLLGSVGPDDKACKAVGDPVLEPSSYRSAGAYWIVRGDSNGNARVEVSIRKAGASDWKTGLPLFRVEKGAHLGDEFGSPLTKTVPEDGWLFGGSQMNLEPGSSYELRLKLEDPDGGAAEKTLIATTKSEPVYEGGRKLHVVPGPGGGAGSEVDPFKGLEQAMESVRPGDRLQVHAGLYPRPLVVKRSGEPGKPIVIEAAGDGDVFVGGVAPGPVGIRAEGVHDVWFDGLTVFRKDVGFSGKDSGALVIRRCLFRDVRNGIVADQNAKDTVRSWWIMDNEIAGVTAWPAKFGDNTSWGLKLTGSDHVVAHNWVERFSIGFATRSSIRCANLDVCHNDFSDCARAGVLVDGAERNIRVFENRIVNAGAGIQSRSVFGGPVYLLRNVLVNLSGQPFAMDARPSGILVWHNTSWRHGSALLLTADAAFRNTSFRNNLFIGTTGEPALRINAEMEGCDLDRDGFAGGPWEGLLAWKREEYRKLPHLKDKAPAYRNAKFFESASLFVAPVQLPPEAGVRMDRRLDLRLDEAAGAVDQAVAIPGLNDTFTGKAPDLGALESGRGLPEYGIRSKEKSRP